MKKIPVLCLLLLLAQSVFSQNILPYPIKQTKLPNGLNVVTVPYASPGLAAFYIVMRVGSRDEIEKGKSGFAHFFEHMMFRGTDKYPTDKYEEIITGLGAAANANTWLDRTVYHMTGNAEKLETMFDIESDRFKNLKYSLPDFKTEAGAVKGEYTKNSASPYSQLEEKVAETAFTNHTYGHTTMGYFTDVVDMPNQYDYSLEFFKRFYRPEYATIIVVGDVKPEKVEALARKYFGDWKRGNYTNSIPPEPAQNETRFTHIQKDNFPPYLNLNYKGPAFQDSNIDCAALDILNEIVFSEKSPLYKKLVLDEQKVRALGGSYTFTRDPYLISVEASLVNAADLQYVKDEISKSLEAAKITAVDAKQLDETKSRLKYGYAMRTDTPTAIAESLSYFTWLTGNPESVNKLYALYDKVTPQDLMRVAAKYYKSSGLTIATISPAATIDVK